LVSALHIFATKGGRNSGDFMLGPSTKESFEVKIGEPVNWTNFNVRKKVRIWHIAYFNRFDYIIIGGGGLFLPDTNPNKISCWQWAISKALLGKIRSKIFVIGIDGIISLADINMPERDSNYSDSSRISIFQENIRELILKSEYFSMRHAKDIDNLINVVGKDLAGRVTFENCPVFDYVRNRYSNKYQGGNGTIAIEIKSDRPNRRYLKTTKQSFYRKLENLVKHLTQKGKKVVILSHDGNLDFYNYLLKNSIEIDLVSNSIENENEIIQNYLKFSMIFCTAGHSQIISHSLGISTFSIISHDKLFYFIEDNKKMDGFHYAYVHDEELLEKMKKFADRRD